jgi:hypothetical protein
MQNASRVTLKWIGVVPNIRSFVCTRISAHRLEESDNDSILNSRKFHLQKLNFLLKPHVFFLHHRIHNSSKDGNYRVKVNRKVETLAAMFVNNSASALQPYMKLMRIDKPIGTNIFNVLNFVPD